MTSAAEPETRIGRAPDARSLVVVAAIVALWATAFAHTLAISDAVADKVAVDPGLWPRMALVLLAAALAATRLRGGGAAAEAGADAAPGIGRALALFGAAALYFVALREVGFVIATPPFLFAVAALAGAGRLGSRAALALGATASAVALFAGALGAPLPRGLLPWAFTLNSRLYDAASVLAAF